MFGDTATVRLFFGDRWDSKLIVSMSLGFSALLRRKPRPSPDSDATSWWLHHGDLVVVVGCHKDEYLHCTDSKLKGERVNITFRRSGTICPGALWVLGLCVWI